MAAAAADPAADDAVVTPKPIKKLCVALITLVPAFALVSVASVVLGHAFAAKAVLFSPPSDPADPDAAVPRPKRKDKKAKREQKREKAPPKVITKTVYVPPTEEDLDRILSELEEEEEALPPVAATTAGADSQRSAAAVRSLLESVRDLSRRRDEERERTRREVDELVAAHGALVARLEGDARRDEGGAEGAGGDAASAGLFQNRTTSLRSLLGRTTFADLDGKDLEEAFAAAKEELRWLRSDEGASALLLDSGNELTTLLKDGAAWASNPTEATCRQTFLALGKGDASPEFARPKPILETKADAKAARRPAPLVTDETARESDLHDLVESVKEVLSRRDVPDGDGEAPDPVGPEAVRDIVAQVVGVASGIRERREAAFEEETNLRNSWLERTEALMSDPVPTDPGPKRSDDGDRRLCASSAVVERMVTQGLDAIRRKADVRSALVGAAAGSYADDPDEAEVLAEELGKASVPSIEYEEDDGRGTPSRSDGSSRRTKRTSVAYAIDGPWLRRGVATWVDRFVDAVSGYNDHVDALIDWAVGEEGGSAGTAAAEGALKLARRVSLPAEYAERWKRSGILGGRIRYRGTGRS